MSQACPVIFLAFANDRQEAARYLRGLPEELRGIRSALNGARRAGAVEVVERSNATLGDIIDVFQDPEYAGRIVAFHYGGHADSYELLLDSGQAGSVEIAHAEGFNRFLAQQEGLRLVFLNGCSTGDQAMGLRMAGLATVIATSEAINDAVAQRFATRFYKGLGSYASLHKAYQDAVAEVLTLTGPDNTRSLYWEESAALPDQYPWQLLPDPPAEWRLQGPQGQSGPELDLSFDELKLGQYAHVLCDRYPQNDEFVSQYLAATPEQPQVFLIHGEREEKHESLITRFSYHYIGPRRNYLRPIEVSNWPSKGDQQTLLKVRLAEHFEGMNTLGKPIDQISGQDLLELTRHSGQEAIILQHNVPGEYWTDETAKLIRWYAGKFWRVRPLLEAPRFVIFINVFYAEAQTESGGGFLGKLFGGKKNDFKRIQKALQQIEKEVPHCELLTQLDRVQRNHVEDWLIETNLAEVADYAGLAQKIFPQTVPLPMGQVEPHLKEAVQALRQKYAQRMM